MWVEVGVYVTVGFALVVLLVAFCWFEIMLMFTFWNTNQSELQMAKKKQKKKNATNAHKYALENIFCCKLSQS